MIVFTVSSNGGIEWWFKKNGKPIDFIFNAYSNADKGIIEAGCLIYFRWLKIIFIVEFLVNAEIENDTTDAVKLNFVIKW